MKVCLFSNFVGEEGPGSDANYSNSFGGDPNFKSFMDEEIRVRMMENRFALSVQDLTLPSFPGRARPQ